MMQYNDLRQYAQKVYEVRMSHSVFLVAFAL